MAGSGRKEQIRDATHQRDRNIPVLPSSQPGPNSNRKTWEWGWGVGLGETYVDPRVQEKLQGREKRLFTPTSPSTHSLLVLRFSLLSDGYPSLGKCKRGRWILSSSLPLSSREGGAETPLPTAQLQKAQNQDAPFFSPTPALTCHASAPHALPGDPRFLQNPFKKPDS